MLSWKASYMNLCGWGVNTHLLMLKMDWWTLINITGVRSAHVSSLFNKTIVLLICWRRGRSLSRSTPYNGNNVRLPLSFLRYLKLSLQTAQGEVRVWQQNIKPGRSIKHYRSNSAGVAWPTKCTLKYMSIGGLRGGGIRATGDGVRFQCNGVDHQNAISCKIYGWITYATKKASQQRLRGTPILRKKYS